MKKMNFAVLVVAMLISAVFFKVEAKAENIPEVKKEKVKELPSTSMPELINFEAEKSTWEEFRKVMINNHGRERAWVFSYRNHSLSGILKNNPELDRKKLFEEFMLSDREKGRLPLLIEGNEFYPELKKADQHKLRASLVVDAITDISNKEEDIVMNLLKFLDKSTLIIPDNNEPYRTGEKILEHSARVWEKGEIQKMTAYERRQLIEYMLTNVDFFNMKIMPKGSNGIFKAKYGRSFETEWIGERGMLISANGVSIGIDAGTLSFRGNILYAGYMDKYGPSRIR